MFFTIYIATYLTSNHKKNLLMSAMPPNHMSTIQVLIYKLLSLIRYLFASKEGERKKFEYHTLLPYKYCFSSISLSSYTPKLWGVHLKQY